MVKKLFIFILSLLVSCSAYAGIISRDNIVSAGGVTIAKLNLDENTIFQEFNGSIDEYNIASNAISDDNLKPALKFSNWYAESLGDWTYTGMLPATSVDLTSDVSAGTSYVKGARVTISATSKTYTASKDTWVYIDSNGTLQYVAVANDAAQPTTPANSLLLAKVVTDGDNITAVTDKRQLTPPNLRVYTDYRQGCIVSYTAAAAIAVNLGEIELGVGSGVGKRRNTSAISLTWADLDTGSEAASALYFVWAYPDPDNTTSFLGKLSLSSSDATGITNERLVGWFRNDESSNISASSVGCYKGDGSGVPNIIRVEGTTDVATTSTTVVQMPDMVAKFYSSGNPVTIDFTAPFYSLNNGAVVTISQDSVSDALVFSRNQHHDSGTGNEAFTSPVTCHWEGLLSKGIHTISAKWYVTSATTINQKGATMGERVLIIEEK